MKAIVCILLLNLPLAAQPKSEDLMIVRDGNLPILLSAPHGGRTPIPNARERRGIGVDKFTTVLDTNTDQLAEVIAKHLEKKLGARPYVVIAKFQRKHADANRAAVNAYESDAAKPVYEQYHRSLEKALAAIAKEWGAGLVVDIHGQGAEVNTIFRGTANGSSVKHLLDRHGDAALTGPNSIIGHLDRSRIKVHPAVGSTDAESRQFNGGYIVQTYGSSDGSGIDAIQLEFGTNLRQRLRLEDTGMKTADAIAAFAKQYLPATKK